MNNDKTYPIGTLGKPWGKEEKLAWLNAQSIKRSYQDEVLSKLNSSIKGFAKVKYGSLPSNPERYPLYAYMSEKWDTSRTSVLITGGVHGYETSGVQGAIAFLHNQATKYTKHFNIVIAPCLSPWGYETINRWNISAIDPNRSFYTDSPAPECSQIMSYVESLPSPIDIHIDLHETTDTDDTEFRPALAARDGLSFSDWGIPDGFYTVANTSNPQLDFQKAVIASVEKVTHIAPPDANNQLIGSDVVAHGIICYDKPALFLCGGFTDANYATTTEVYPDSPKTTPQECIVAQVAAITGGLDFALGLKVNC